MNLQTLVKRSISIPVSGVKRPPRPEPFVEPRLNAVGELSDPRVVMVSAPAAVGKSTLAKWLALETNAHFLDLGKIHVGSQGFIGNLAASGLQQAFNEGRLTVVVDALDEGFVRSGFGNYEAFFSDLAGTVESVRSVWDPDTTRLILLGRDEYVELAAIILEDRGAAFDTLSLDYMDKAQATKLALAFTKARAGEAFHEEASERAIEAFFRAAARALRVDYSDLWSDRLGRGFAGYPPVLDAVAQVIYTNPAVALSEWGDESAEWRNAWQLLTDTAQRLLRRERKRLVENVGVEVPEGAYDSEHQLTLLAGALRGERVDPCKGLAFESDETEQVFREAAEGQLEGHPFVAEGASDVFGSMVVAAAVERGDSLEGAEAKAAQYSRWPFVWRFFSERVRESETTPLVDGAYLGWVLASVWLGLKGEEDPGTTTIKEARGSDELTAAITQGDTGVRLRVIGPVIFKGVARAVRLDVPSEVVRFGARGPDPDATVFVLDRLCSITARELQVGVPEILLEPGAEVTIDVERCDSAMIQRVKSLPGAQIAVSDAVYHHPWTRVAQRLEAPPPENRLLDRFLRDVAHTLPGEGQAAVLDEAARPLEDDQTFVGWPAAYREALRSLVLQLEELDAVTRAVQDAGGPDNVVRYRPQGFTWGDLWDGVPDRKPWASVDWSKVKQHLPER